MRICYLGLGSQQSAIVAAVTAFVTNAGSHSIKAVTLRLNEHNSITQTINLLQKLTSCK